MRHKPVFRWVLTLGVVLFGWAAYLYWSYPDVQRVELTVLSEKSDGRCTVRWDDPYHDGSRQMEGAYQCDASRGSSLKPTHSVLGTDAGWDTGYMYTEGPRKGHLEPADDDFEPYATSDMLVLSGVALIAVGLVGGNLRAAARLSGVRPRTVARARKLYTVADQVARDHARARDAVRAAWEALRRERTGAELSRVPAAALAGDATADPDAITGQEATNDQDALRVLATAGVRTARDVLDAGVAGLRHMGVSTCVAEQLHAAARSRADAIEGALPMRLESDSSTERNVALLAALQVLLDAGDEARRTAHAGASLAAELEQALQRAEPASTYRTMLRAGREQREAARDAIDHLRRLVARAERDGLPARFAQTSVDLLRAPDVRRQAGLSARADFENRSGRYYGLLAHVVDEAEEAGAGVPSLS
ncbi:hypothetical protein [Streptomyces sp. NPDC046939]|uniref:hypothetical protein n=1 Tax=Streptomyces sp. NPDC046939 TaxID=3155376 RepID=UPI0033D6D987